jgi:hypothetical protein
VVIRRAGGFSLVELAVALAVMIAVFGAVFPLFVRASATFDARGEMADMQQRLRVASDTLFEHLVAAGAAAYSGSFADPLGRAFVPIVPYRTGGTVRDPPGTYRTDTITIFTVPRAVAAPAGVTYWLKADAAAGTYQLMMNETSNTTDLPVVDHVVVVAFDYYGDPQPPQLRQPADAFGPWKTTYGPPPGTTAVAPFDAGENCIFALGATAPQPRLAVRGDPGSALVRLTAADFTDGPWCPHDQDPDRWDADLLRIRAVNVTVRVQAAQAALRGPASVLFAHGGTSRSADRWVPDQETQFQVAPRNLNFGR